MGPFARRRQCPSGCSRWLAILVIASPAAYAELDEVVVTATKRAESLGKVAITMQAIGSEAIAARGIDSAEDVLLALSNLSINGSNEVNKGFTIRGVGTNNFHGNVNRAVGIYQDEVSLNTPYTGVLGVYDMERIELLRGPQNTLFGRNTTGGAINYITVKPEIGAGPNGYARLLLGEDSQVDVDGALGFDLGDRAAARIAVQSVNRDGLFVNQALGREGESLGDRERHSGRAQLTWRPSDSTELLVNLYGSYNRGSSIGNKTTGIRDPADPGQQCDFSEVVAGSSHEARNNCVASNGFNPSSDDWRTVYNSSGAQSDIDIEGGFLRLDSDVGEYTITGIAAISKTNVQLADDTAGYNVPRFTPTQDSEFDQLSIEARISSPDAGSFRWLAGLFYFDEDMRQGTNIRNAGVGAFASNILDQNDRDLSAYLQFDVDWTEKLEVSVGLRYTDNEKVADSSAFRVVPLGPNGFTDPLRFVTNEELEAAAIVPRELILTDLKEEFSDLGGKLALRYELTDSAMLYGSYSRGFKSGGFDTRAIAFLQGGDPSVPVGPESLDAWEIGVKSTLADGRLRLNLAAFLYDWEDLQTFVVLNGVPSFANIPESELKGVEIEAAWAPTPDWTISAAVGLLDTEVLENGELQSSVDVGHPLPNAPEVSFNASIVRTIDLAAGEVTLRADYLYTDEAVDALLFAQDPYSTKASTTFLDARAFYRFGAERQFEISLWGENLTEERTCFDIGSVDNPRVVAPNALTSTTQCSPSDGQRRFGITASVSF